jgi:hypothetical protein
MNGSRETHRVLLYGYSAAYKNAMMVVVVASDDTTKTQSEEIDIYKIHIYCKYDCITHYSFNLNKQLINSYD